MSDPTENTEHEPEPTPEEETSGFTVESGGKPPAEEKPAQPADEEDAGKVAAKGDEADDDDDGDKARADDLPPGVIKRLQRLKQRERDAITENEKLRAQLRDRGEEVPEQAEPEAADFDTYEEFQAALDKWQGAKKDAKPGKGKAADDPNDPASPAALSRNTKAIHDALAADAADVWKTLTGKDTGGNYEITGPMMAAWAESDDPVAIGRYLAEHPDDTFEIAGMTPKQIERRFLKIELAAQSAPAEKPKAEAADEKPKRKPSGAPDPIETGGRRRAAELTPEEAANRGDFRTFEKLRAQDEEASVGGW